MTIQDVVDRIHSFELEVLNTTSRTADWVAKPNALKPYPNSIRKRLKIGTQRLLRPKSFALVSAGLSASRIRIKNNVLVFYEDEGIVAKLFHRKAALDAHLRGVRGGARMSDVKVPDVLGHGTAPVPWIIHPIVQGQSPTAQQLMQANGLLEDLARLHGPGLEYKSFGISGDELDRLQEVVQPIGVAIGPRTTRVLLGANSARGLLGSTHGDLSLKNFILNQELFLIDWETAGHDFVVRDLLATPPSLWIRYVNALSGLGIGETVESLRRQAVIYQVMKLHEAIKFQQHDLSLQKLLEKVEEIAATID